MKRAAASSTRRSSERKSTSMFAGINRTNNSNNSDSKASNTAYTISLKAVHKTIPQTPK